MTKHKIFILLKLTHIFLDNLFTLVFPGRFRHIYVHLSYRIKTKFFPEYGEYVSAVTAISPTRESTSWVPPVIPIWALEEMKELAQEIDPIIYPSDSFLAKCTYYALHQISLPGEIYRELIQSCNSCNYTHCFAIPWLMRGGADLVTLMHIKDISSRRYTKVLVILTEPVAVKSPWISRIPAGVDIIDVSKFVGMISHNHLLMLIARIQVQLHIDTLHIINSRLVWEAVCVYGMAITQRTRIFASIYCDDFDKNRQPVGFAREYLPECYKYLHKVFTDNLTFPRLLCRTYGYHPDFFQVLKSPINVSVNFTNIRTPTGRRVLWAGRIDRQKNPDLLLSIAKLLPEVEFHVYGEEVLDKRTNITSKLKRLKNVFLYGGFNGVESLPFSKFPLFLYTSQWDGTPTIIIAAALASIPIVASQVGGVGDIVTEARGYPIHNIENSSDYVKNIIDALDDPNNAESKAALAHEYVLREHSASAFSKALEATPDYISPIHIITA